MNMSPYGLKCKGRPSLCTRTIYIDMHIIIIIADVMVGYQVRNGGQRNCVLHKIIGPSRSALLLPQKKNNKINFDGVYASHLHSAHELDFFFLFKI